MDLAPAALDRFVESAIILIDGVPVLGNTAICVDSLCTTGRASMNFYCSPNPLQKALSFLWCKLCKWSNGAVSLGTGRLVLSQMGSLGAREFNCLGKYTLHLGNITSGNFTNSTDIAGLMS